MIRRAISAPASISVDQIRALQAARRGLGMGDDDYRAWLSHQAGVTSTRDLTRSQAAGLLDELNRRRGGSERPSAVRASGRYAGKLRALWISAYQLGIVRERDDRALLAFVERQTGLSHSRFLTDAKDAFKAIEALKAWMTREAGVEWPRERADAIAARRAVIAAQVARLAEADAAFELPACADLDETIAALGRRIRKSVARAA